MTYPTKKFRTSTFRYWLARQLRPFQRLPLSDRLTPWNVGISLYQEEAMEHAASRSQSYGFPCDIFEIIGMEYVPQALKVWRPRELYLMLLIQLAFDAVEEQRTHGIAVEEIHRERLIEVLAEYFRYLGKKDSALHTRQLVESYLAERSLSDPISADEANQPIEIDLPLLDELPTVDREMRERFPGEKWDLGLQSLGLMLTKEVGEIHYSCCTPVNCRSFASTGGDGCHFSLFVQDGRITEKSFVVMTVPDALANVIVGENLFDFLCLGVRRGYFSLAYISNYLSSSEILDAYTNPNWQPSTSQDAFPDPEQLPKLHWLAERLKLQPWNDSRRFFELQEKYLPLIKLPPDALG